jgi:bifunctional DNA-binding transcriptional regulator/antitoxin component of YhaV-PrlF toxin-antitoxin module
MGDSNETAVQVSKRGTISLPAELRAQYHIQPGDTFRLLDLNRTFILTPMVPMLPELAREIERARVEAGLSTEGMLRGLREQRERYCAEKYATDATTA